ncbi:FecCD family ABC transporter permease [Nakamurella sp. GG22]
MRTRPVLVLAALALLTLVTAVLAFGVGSVPIPPSATVQYLLTGDAGDPTTTVLLAEVRMPRVITAIIAGAGLAVAGLLMQTLFANPLADPYILGVSSGAGLGVALSVLGTGTAAGVFATTIGVSGRFRTVVAAALGALAILLLVLALARWVRSVVALLIIGVMIGAAAGALISLLLAYSDPARIQKFVLWGLGSVSGTTRADLWFLGIPVLVGILLAGLVSGSLNALLLGETYAASMGVAVRRLRTIAIVATALIAGAITAFCGPIAFLGIAIPHLARLALGRADHRLLLPASVLMGAVVCQVCAVIAVLPGSEGVLPLNVVTAAIGAPVVVAALLRSRTLAAGAA